MKTIITITIIATILLGICWFLSLIRDKNTKRNARWTNLILPLFVLVMFVSLFVGGSISRSNIKKELVTLQAEDNNRSATSNGGLSSEEYMKENLTEEQTKEALLKELEKKNADISLIIGPDTTIESLIASLQSY